MKSEWLGLSELEWAHIVGSSLLVAIIFIFNPFDIRDAAEEHYQSNVTRLIEPFYKEGEEEVVVVLIDSKFLKDAGGFPASFTSLSQLLRSVATFEPNGVYFNFLQVDEHSPSINRWLATLEKYAREFPIFLASDPKLDDALAFLDSDSLRYRLHQAVNESFSAASWSQMGSYYPLSVPWRNLAAKCHFLGYEYAPPSNESYCNGSDEVGVVFPEGMYRMPTPAYALYLHYCQLNASNQEVVEACQALNWSNREELSPMLIRWRKTIPTESERSTSNKIFEAYQELEVMMTLGTYGEEEFDATTRVTAPPIEYVLASDLVSREGRTSAKLRDAIEGRMVMVGYLLSQNMDSVISPLHGSIPSVFMHAMALDNLIRYGQSYWHMPDEDVFLGLELNDFIEFFVNVFAFGVLLFARKRYVDISSARQAYRTQNAEQIRVLEIQNFRMLALLFVPAILMLFSIWLSDSVYKFGIANWFALPIIFIVSLPMILEIVFVNILLGGKRDECSSSTGIRRSIYHKVDNFKLREGIVMKSLVIIVVSSILLFSVKAFSEVRIVGFPLKVTELCDEDWNCEDVPSSSIQAGAKVLAVNKQDNMLKFKHKGKEIWVHTTEVELSGKAIASSKCGALPGVEGQSISEPGDTQDVLIGAGEEC